EWLINKRQRSLNLKRQLISRAYSRAKTMRGIRRGRHTANRYWKDGEMHLTLAPTFPRLPLMAHREWLETCKESRVEMNSRPGFLPNGRLQLVSGGIFYDSEYSYSEYQSQGLIFHEFDYWWDYLNPNTSATRRQLYSNAVAALVASTLLNAKTVYRL